MREVGILRRSAEGRLIKDQRKGTLRAEVCSRWKARQLQEGRGLGKTEDAEGRAQPSWGRPGVWNAAQGGRGTLQPKGLSKDIVTIRRETTRKLYDLSEKR